MENIKALKKQFRKLKAEVHPKNLEINGLEIQIANIEEATEIKKLEGIYKGKYFKFIGSKRQYYSRVFFIRAVKNDWTLIVDSVIQFDFGHFELKMKEEYPVTSLKKWVEISKEEFMGKLEEAKYQTEQMGFYKNEG